VGALLLLGTVLGIGGLTLAALFLLLTGARRRAAIAAAVIGVWILAYGVLLVGTSLLSHEEVLVPGEVKYFCGFLLDCHIGVAAQSVRAAGHEQVVTLRFSSSARRATLSPYDVQLTLIGSDGRSYPGTVRGRQPLERQIAPGGGYDVEVAFELPDGARPQRLLVSEGVGFDRVVDALVIGIEPSFLHKRTYLALPTAS